MSIHRTYENIRRAALAAVVAVAALAAGPAFAQGTGSVEGTVTARGSGAPLAGVSVRVDGAAPVQTDARGRFRIARVAAGAHTLTATRLGLAPASQPVAVAPGAAARVDVRVAEESTVLPSLVVSTTREVRRLDETPASVGVVSSATLREAKPTHPGEVMGQVPGVWVSVTGGEGHTTAIRQPKTTNPVYLFLEDGVPTRSTGFFNHNALYEVDVPQAERIEVLKGPASALYGSDAIGGVINVETRAPTARPGYEAYAEGGAYGWGRLLLAASTTRGADGVRADVNLTRTGGWRQGTDYTRQSGNLRWDHHFGGASLKTVLAVSHIDQQTAGASTLLTADYRANPTLNYTPISFRRVSALRLSTDYERQGAASLLSIIPFVRWNSMDLLPNWSLTYDPTVYTTGHHSLGLLAKYRVDVDALRTRLIGGVDVDYSPGYRDEDLIKPARTGEVFNGYQPVERIYDYAVTFHGVSPYLQAEVAPAGRLHLTGGVRWDNIGFAYDNHLSALATGKYRRPDDTSVGYHHLSPKLGVTYEAGRALALFGSYTTGFRSPSEGQLFRQGQADNTVALNPVDATSVEAGARGQAGPLGYQVSAYRMRITNDVLTYVNPDGTRETVNAGGTLHRGVEAGVGARLPAGFRADVSYSRAKHSYVEWSPKPGADFAGNEMESAPRTLLNARLGWSFAGSGRLSAEWQRVGSYWEDPENTHRYGGHALVNLHATVPVRPGVEMVGRMNNLLDRRYAEAAQFTVSRGEELAPGMPRSLYLGVQLRAGH